MKNKIKDFYTEWLTKRYLLIAIISINLIAKSVAISCKIGYFEQNGLCIQCDDSCYTCTNATECTSCFNRILNNSTKLCEFCAYGHFYSPQLDNCVDCAGSCHEECRYQDKCFVCPQGMSYDLTLLKCVNNCTSSQVFIQDTLLKNIPICRDTTFYIDPNGLQPLELGTQKYPYKKIGFSSMEVLNFMSHSNRNITIYIKENSIIYMTNLRNFFIDFPNIVITTYSSTENAPQRATIQITDRKQSYFSGSTQFNIVSNVVLRLNDALNYTGYTSVEKDISSYSTAILITNRCSLSISNIDVYRDVVADKNLDVPFIIAIYEQAHTVTMKNMDFHIKIKFINSSSIAYFLLYFYSQFFNFACENFN